MPCYNAGRWVVSAVESVLAQTCRDLELLVVDDASGDDSVARLEAFRREPRFRLLRNERNIGQSASANRGWALARGEYIKFFDADDLMSSDFLESQLNRLAGRDDAVVSAAWGRFHGDDLSTFRPNPEAVWRDMESTDWLVESWITGRCMMQCGLWLIPRRIVERVGGWNERLSLINDFEFFARILCAAREVLFCPDAVLRYRSGVAGSLSGRKSRAAYDSMVDSILLGTGHLLAKRSDVRARRAAANVCQSGIYEIYPGHPDLVEQLHARVGELGGADLPVSGGRGFQILRRVVGWKAARRLMSLAGR
jgi:glycosyltransferase involved in cell wall biosynthesis